MERPVCDVLRVQGAMADSRQMFQDDIGEANRTSTSFYTVGLPAACGAGAARCRPRGSKWRSRHATRERMPFTTSVEELDSHAGGRETDLAIVDSNDFKTGLQRIADDFNAYYLLGYTSSNGKADGSTARSR